MTFTKLSSELREQYFDELEFQCVVYTEYDDSGDSTIKQEYLIGVDEMAQYLGFSDFSDWYEDYSKKTLQAPNWVTKWGVDVMKQLDNLTIRKVNI